MGRLPRHLAEPGCPVEVTVRTPDSRYLLRPSRRLNRIFAGCLGKALELYPVRLHAVVVLSSHYHCLLSPEDSQQLARFMCHLNTNLSKEIGRLHDWSGSIFQGRYQCIPISGEPKAQQARLRYLLRHGCKEGLVLGPRDWPGIHSAAALCDGTPIVGTWLDRTAYWHARNRGEDCGASQFTTRYEIRLEPLPCWEHLDDEVWRSLVREMVADIEVETRAEHKRDGTIPCGASAVLRKPPHYLPGRQKRSPAPRFHVASRAAWDELVAGLREFVAAYRRAAEGVAAGVQSVRFPSDCFPSRLPYVPPC